MNQLETFKATASQFNAAKASASTSKGLANTLIGQALYIIKQGTLQEQVALQRYVSKDGEGHAYRQYVSKGKNIAEHFALHDVVVMKDGSEVSKAMIEAGSFDALPSITFSSVDAAIRAVNKVQDEGESRAKQALALGAEAEGLSKDDVKALSSEAKARLVATGEAILNAQEAKAAMPNFDAIKDAISRLAPAERLALVDYITTLEGEEAQAA